MMDISYIKIPIKRNTNGDTRVATRVPYLLSRCPDDVNLVDVMEMVCDCVCAGLARSGSVRPVEIPSDILQKAVANTAKLVEDMCEIVEDE